MHAWVNAIATRGKALGARAKPIVSSATPVGPGVWFIDAPVKPGDAVVMCDDGPARPRGGMARGVGCAARGDVDRARSIGAGAGLRRRRAMCSARRECRRLRSLLPGNQRPARGAKHSPESFRSAAFWHSGPAIMVYEMRRGPCGEPEQDLIRTAMQFIPTTTDTQKGQDSTSTRTMRTTGYAHNANGVTHAYQYDALNRLRDLTVPHSSFVTWTTASVSPATAARSRKPMLATRYFSSPSAAGRSRPRISRGSSPATSAVRVWRKCGSCHLFRHTLATLMLENPADVRHVQAMLGHACLQTSQLYTLVSIKACWTSTPAPIPTTTNSLPSGRQRLAAAEAGRRTCRRRGRAVA